MRLVFHGGKCCGIKTIYGFERPDYFVSPEEKRGFICPDEYGHHVSSDTDFFTDEAPEETELERFDRLIEFCENHRPNGIIEAVLASSDYKDYNQPPFWEEHFLKRNFKLVNQCLNSNSGNTVYVYHRNSGEKPNV
jgi:hypothetical protein